MESAVDADNVQVLMGLRSDARDGVCQGLGGVIGRNNDRNIRPPTLPKTADRVHLRSAVIAAPGWIVFSPSFVPAESTDTVFLLSTEYSAWTYGHEGKVRH